MSPQQFDLSFLVRDKRDGIGRERVVLLNNTTDLDAKDVHNYALDFFPGNDTKDDFIDEDDEECCSTATDDSKEDQVLDKPAGTRPGYRHVLKITQNDDCVVAIMLCTRENFARGQDFTESSISMPEDVQRTLHNCLQAALKSINPDQTVAHAPPASKPPASVPPKSESPDPKSPIFCVGLNAGDFILLTVRFVIQDSRYCKPREVTPAGASCYSCVFERNRTGVTLKNDIGCLVESLRRDRHHCPELSELEYRRYLVECRAWKSNGREIRSGIHLSDLAQKHKLSAVMLYAVIHPLRPYKLDAPSFKKTIHTWLPHSENDPPKIVGLSARKY